MTPASRCSSFLFTGSLLVPLLFTACATAPPSKAPAVPLEQRLAWILQLEDQRLMRLPPPPEPAPAPQEKRHRRPPVLPPPASSPDLAVLVKDEDARVRRRAALAIGRVKLREGVKPLVATLADADPEVRATAAFALGLIGDASAEPALVPLLSDAVPLVRGRAAEALGQIDAKGSADAIGKMVAEYARAAAVTSMPPDNEDWPAAAEAEAFRLGLFALVRLRAYDPIAAAVLESSRPLTQWWPVAFALQRINDKRAAPALLELLAGPGRYARAFAARGLGGLKDIAAARPLIALLDPSPRTELEVAVAAVRALGQIGSMDAVPAISRLAADPSVHPNLRLEAVGALGALKAPESLDLVQNLITEEWTPLRIAALQAVAAIDQESFTFVLAGVESDPDWRVRAALAGLFGALPAESASQRLRPMLEDSDKRVIPAVLDALARIEAPDLPTILLDRLEDPDFGVRSTAATLIGRLKPPDAPDALKAAYRASLPDSAYAARAAIIDALAQYGVEEAIDTLRAALSDKDWAVRVKAAELLAKLEPQGDHQGAIRPAPGSPAIAYDDPQMLSPQYSPHVFIETAHGTIEFELAVLDAPQTTRHFMALVRKGFFNGLEVHRVVANFVVQDGDPRGDGKGGPGHTIRDELNERPFLRGTVGMALAWPDTAGSQFFITVSPQPHLDARYTAFGHVVTGLEVVDRIRPGDVIQRVRVWDGERWN